MYLFQDWVSNRRNPKAQLILVAFRLASACNAFRKPWVFLAYPYLIFYRIVVEWLLGVEIPWKLKVGSGLKIFHGVGLVVNDRAVIGRNVVLRHCTTIGINETLPFGEGVAPIIEDDVDIGSNVVIIGNIRIGVGAKIGAGSVVIRDVASGAIVVGNPAREVAGNNKLNS